MNKRMRELKASMEQALNKAKAAMDGENKDVEKADEAMKEYKSLKKEYETEKEIFEAEKSEGKPSAEELTKLADGKKDDEVEKNKSEGKVDAVKSFAKAARAGFTKSLNEGTNTDGGYTVPEDIVNKVEKLKEAKYSLANDVTVETVTTLSGRRTFIAKAQQTGFSKVAESGKIAASETPTFTVLEYKVDKYAGAFPVTNELLADSDENITSVLTNWIAEEERVTDNKLILAVAQANTETDLKNLDGIKNALNVTLGQAYKPTSKIYTNDDGLQYLDTLKDQDGRYLLQPTPNDPMQMRLCAGATTIPVVVIPNTDLATKTGKVPFIIGDLKEGITYFKRAGITIKASDTATIGTLNAYEQDLTLFRAIIRADVVKRDGDAWVNGYIKPAGE